MKARSRVWVLVGLVTLFASGGLFAYNRSRIGRVLDQYCGIPVYDNGLLFFRSHGKNFSQDGYYYGQKWQCVEYVKRFYFETKRHKMPDVMGHAKSFFNDSLSDGALNARRGLVQYRNGSKERPKPDDLLVFTDTKYGHVGIVDDAPADSIEIIQQNILGHTRQRLWLVTSNEHFFVTGPRIPAGWLRVPAGQAP